jgi:hypothetical protein
MGRPPSCLLVPLRAGGFWARIIVEQYALGWAFQIVKLSPRRHPKKKPDNQSDNDQANDDK